MADGCGEDGRIFGPYYDLPATNDEGRHHRNAHCAKLSLFGTHCFDVFIGSEIGLNFGGGIIAFHGCLQQYRRITDRFAPLKLGGEKPLDQRFGIARC